MHEISAPPDVFSKIPVSSSAKEGFPSPKEVLLTNGGKSVDWLTAMYHVMLTTAVGLPSTFQSMLCSGYTYRLPACEMLYCNGSKRTKDANVRINHFLSSGRRWSVYEGSIHVNAHDSERHSNDDAGYSTIAADTFASHLIRIGSPQPGQTHNTRARPRLSDQSDSSSGTTLVSAGLSQHPSPTVTLFSESQEDWMPVAVKLACPSWPELLGKEDHHETLEDSGGSSIQPTANAIHTEAKIYTEALLPIQGTHVARFYGLWKVQVKDSEAGTHDLYVMVIELLGKSIFESIRVPREADYFTR